MYSQQIGANQQQLPFPMQGVSSAFQPLNLGQNPTAAAAAHQSQQSPASVPIYASAGAHTQYNSGPGVRYGSGASVRSAGRSNSRRGRSRDRDATSQHRSISTVNPRDSVSQQPSRQSRQMGPQETLDWEFTIDNITDRLNALENQNRSHAQRTADIQGAINMVDAKIVTANEDIGE